MTSAYATTKSKETAPDSKRPRTRMSDGTVIQRPWSSRLRATRSRRSPPGQAKNLAPCDRRAWKAAGRATALVAQAGRAAGPLVKPGRRRSQVRIVMLWAAARHDMGAERWEGA